MAIKKNLESPSSPLKMEIQFDEAEAFTFTSGYIAPLKNSDYDYVLFLKKVIKEPPPEYLPD